MPIVQDEVGGNVLNHFLDVAIRDDRELNPIVYAARRQNDHHEPLSPSSRRLKSTRMRRLRWDNNDNKSICSAPATARSHARFHDVSLNNDEASLPPLHRTRDDASYDSDGDLHFFPDRIELFGPNIKDVQNNEVGESSAEGNSLGQINQADLRVEQQAEKIMSLEQDMAKINFELAEARAQVDWYKLQNRQLHLEFGDLQAFCKQLQDENLELRENKTDRRRKPNWFKAAKRLNRPRTRVDYADTPQAVQERASLQCEESIHTHGNDSKHASDSDWDDDTLTTNFGGMSNDSLAQRTGPLFSGLLVKSPPLNELGSPGSNDKPRDITVKNNSGTNLADGSSKQRGGLDDSNESTEQTQFGDSFHLGDAERIEEPQSDAVVEKQSRGILGGRFNKFSGSQSATTPRRREQSSIASSETSQSAKTLPAKGWNMKGRLPGQRGEQQEESAPTPQMREHRFVPRRRSSTLGPNSSNHNCNMDFDDLELLDSTSKHDEKEDAIDKVTATEDKKKGGKPWWSKVKPIQQIQNIQNRAENAIQSFQTRGECRTSQVAESRRSSGVGNHARACLPDLTEDELEQSRGDELDTLTDRRSKESLETCSSEDEMPCDLSHTSMHAQAVPEPPSPTERLACESDYFNDFSVLGPYDGAIDK